MDLGIKYALRDLPPYMVDETCEILLARQLRAKCLLLESMYPEAEVEAENCIRTMRRVMPSHIASVLYVQAEALYLQCQVEKASSLGSAWWRRGMRNRKESLHYAGIWQVPGILLPPPASFHKSFCDESQTGAQ